MGASEMLIYKDDWISRSLNSCQDHSIFLLSLFGGKNSIYKRFQNSIFHGFHFNNSYFIAVVEVLFLIYY